jgi:hypothetical protein
MSGKRVVVKLHNIMNENTGSDPGNSLEVYGSFDVACLAFSPNIGEVVTINSANLFNRSGDNAQDIVEGTAFIVERSAQFDMVDGQFLQISGHLREHDTFGPDDDLGTLDFRIPFNQIKNEILPIGTFEESDQRVTVKMSTTVTPIP